MAIAMPELHVGRGTSVGPLTVFPLWTGAAAPAALVTGQAAHVTVTERTPAVVEEVVLANSGDRMALLLEGELLEGGWQHRVLQHDMILDPAIPLPTPVACVEQHRWQGPSGFQRQGRRASASVRAALSTPSGLSRQHEVWDRVARYADTFGPSTTASYLDFLDRLDVPAADLFFDPDGQRAEVVRQIRQLRPLPGQRGLIAGVAGHPVLAELFASPTALAAHMRPLLTGLLLDTVTADGPEQPVPSRRARHFAGWLDGIRAAGKARSPAGAGVAFAAQTPDVLVQGVGLSGRWAHMAALNRRHALLRIG